MSKPHSFMLGALFGFVWAIFIVVINILLFGCAATPTPAVPVIGPVINKLDVGDRAATCEMFEFQILETYSDTDGWIFVQVDLGCDGECDLIDIFLPTEHEYEDGLPYYVTASMALGRGPWPCEMWDRVVNGSKNYDKTSDENAI